MPHATSADRVRDYQERLRALDAQAAQRGTGGGLGRAVAAALVRQRRAGRAPQVDPLVAERQRRDYESLFASNVVLSRRPERPDSRTLASARRRRCRRGRVGRKPSIDDIADAVVRATSAWNGSGCVPVPARRTATATIAEPAVAGNRADACQDRRRPDQRGRARCTASSKAR